MKLKSQTSGVIVTHCVTCFFPVTNKYHGGLTGMCKERCAAIRGYVKNRDETRWDETKDESLRWFLCDFLSRATYIDADIRVAKSRNSRYTEINMWVTRAAREKRYIKNCYESSLRKASDCGLMNYSYRVKNIDRSATTIWNMCHQLPIIISRNI